MSSRFTELLQSIADRSRLLVIGDVMLDEYVEGKVERISPEAPVPIVRFTEKRYALGGAANAAHNASSLGAVVRLISVVGWDEDGVRLKEMAARANLDPTLIKDENRMTTRKLRIVAANQQVARVDYEDSHLLGPHLEAEVLREVSQHLPSASAVLISDYAKGLVTPTVSKRTIAQCNSLGIPVVVDPKRKDLNAYRNATVVTPNMEEAVSAIGTYSEVDDISILGRKLCEALDGSNVVLTRGSAGMKIFSESMPSHEVSATAMNVFDVTGAGDTVAATLAAALGVGSDLVLATELANLAAGAVVQKSGTSVVEVTDLLESNLQ